MAYDYQLTSRPHPDPTQREWEQNLDWKVAGPMLFRAVQDLIAAQGNRKGDKQRRADILDSLNHEFKFNVLNAAKALYAGASSPATAPDPAGGIGIRADRRGSQ